MIFRMLFYFRHSVRKVSFSTRSPKACAQNQTFHTSYQKVLYNTCSGKRFSSHVHTKKKVNVTRDENLLSRTRIVMYYYSYCI